MLGTAMTTGWWQGFTECPSLAAYFRRAPAQTI